MKYLITFLILIFSKTSFAMMVSCNSPESYFEKADVVFVGTVVKRIAIDEKNHNGICWTQEMGSKCGSKIVTLEMDKSLKGEFRKMVTVSAGDGCYCVEPYLESGSRYIIFAVKGDEQAEYASMNSCATTEYNEHYLKSLPVK